MFRVLRYCVDDRTWVQRRVNIPIILQEYLGFLRSGPYHLLAVILHHSTTVTGGHYTIFVVLKAWKRKVRIVGIVTQV